MVINWIKKKKKKKQNNEEKKMLNSFSRKGKTNKSTNFNDLCGVMVGVFHTVILDEQKSV